ncbi:DUF2512 family protein [Heyndrickxia camelliae]|uniref:DUF2512 domain-containing protein n=1 Tax=Heyndrickxia camelliae TaxID=1707093 RepID=A0A2N3LJH8_9BACI|nr:DUF2512 family protein [Heyndrickxia camelliae]PKR84693.1 hypothetical protein CWO92_13380 [Heyndrickxia camelliae]
MRHIISLIIKFIFVAIFTFSVLGIFNFSIASIFTTALVLTLASYLIGDLLIYRLGSVTAVVADFILYFGMLAVIEYFYFQLPLSRTLYSAFFTSVFITGAEALYHGFVIHRYFEEDDNNRPTPINTSRYSTEFSEELDNPSDKDNEK